MGKLTGLGNTRQIAVSRAYAFITAREEGLFIVDCRQPAAPKLVHHYDTAELATAIAVSGDLLAVGNRFAGIELLDVSDPSDPKYLTTIRVGEVQSLVFHGNWLYAGTWSEKALAVIDVSQPARPKWVKTVSLDGKGDGLDVAGNLLAVATGHHARSPSSPSQVKQPSVEGMASSFTTYPTQLSPSIFRRSSSRRSIVSAWICGALSSQVAMHS